MMYVFWLRQSYHRKIVIYHHIFISFILNWSVDSLFAPYSRGTIRSTIHTIQQLVMVHVKIQQTEAMMYVFWLRQSYHHKIVIYHHILIYIILNWQADALFKPYSRGTIDRTSHTMQQLVMVCVKIQQTEAMMYVLWLRQSYHRKIVIYHHIFIYIILNWSTDVLLKPVLTGIS